jgi:hypothetical protein
LWVGEEEQGMRRLSILTAATAALALAACGDGGVREENAPEAAADAAAVDDALASDAAAPAAGEQSRTGQAATSTDTRGTTGTTPVDGSGKPSTTLPTLPPDNPGDTPPTSPPT